MQPKLVVNNAPTSQMPSSLRFCSLCFWKMLVLFKKHPLELSVLSLHLWAIVCPSNPCFIPNLSVAMKGTKLGAGSYNWASVEKLLLDLILISIKKMRTAMKAQLKSNPKNWG